ncbi:MAG: cation:proton antiporter regulatory subunit [Actinomycetota bacterium]
MGDVRETLLPGVGVRHDFVTSWGLPLAVLIHHDGRREVLVYSKEDPDACSAVVKLTNDESRTLAELLGASQVVEQVGLVQHEIEGLSMEWVEVPAGSHADGRTIGEGAYRTRTGASVVAVLRNDEPIAAPGPDFQTVAGDTIVAIGTTEGLNTLRSIVRS